MGTRYIWLGYVDVEVNSIVCVLFREKTVITIVISYYSNKVT